MYLHTEGANRVKRKRAFTPKVSDSDLLEAVDYPLHICKRSISDYGQVVEECLGSCMTACKRLENLDFPFGFGLGAMD